MQILEYRNVWILNPRNFGDSDHHRSFALDEVADDIARFVNDQKLTTVTVGGHGYGAKVACAFGSYHMDKTTGVMCLEGGPYDHSYHEAWEEVRTIIERCFNEISLENANVNDVYKQIDNFTTVYMTHNFSILNGDK